MKKLSTLFVVLPGMSLAHGGHAPLPEAAHTVSHAAPLIGVGLICVAVGLAIHNRWFS